MQETSNRGPDIGLLAQRVQKRGLNNTVMVEDIFAKELKEAGRCKCGLTHCEPVPDRQVAHQRIKPQVETALIIARHGDTDLIVACQAPRLQWFSQECREPASTGRWEARQICGNGGAVRLE